MRFAGEVTCDDLGGFTPGELQSGIEAVAHYLRVVYSVGKGPRPADQHDRLSLCD